jgi:hypothetical protein
MRRIEMSEWRNKRIYERKHKKKLVRKNLQKNF